LSAKKEHEQRVVARIPTAMLVTDILKRNGADLLIGWVLAGNGYLVGT
jgi:hypothetical protein